MSVETILALRTREAEPAAAESAADRLATLFELHHQRLYAIALRMAGDPDEARDLVQDSFLRAARAPQRVPAGAAAEPWMVRVLVNLCRDRWRRLRVRRSHRDDIPIPPQDSSPESRAIARATVRWALAQLPPRRRAVVVLRELEGLDAAATGRLLGLREATVRWHLSAARRQLRQILGTGEDGE